MERKLASIQKILKIEDIVFQNDKGEDEVAQNIVKATVLGWQCVTQRSNGFKEGDLVVYFEVDSLIPAKPEFEFLRKKPEETSFRIKTIKLKGQYAQGLILPLEALTSTFEIADKSLWWDDNTPTYRYKNPADAGSMADIVIFHPVEGCDLTTTLKITKYEPEVPAHLAGLTMGEFPQFVSKTDETRIQTAPGVLVKRKGEKMYATEKVDGSSITCFYVPAGFPGLPAKYADEPPDENGNIFGIASRNLSIKFSEDNAFWKTAMHYGVPEKMKKYGGPLVIQGELYGTGVNKNRLKLNDLRLAWFNAVDPVERRYLDYFEFLEVIHGLGLHTVPILDDEFVLDHTVEQLVTYAMGNSKINPQVMREGVVFRPLVESQERHLGRFSFKVINPQYLVKHGE